MSGSAFERNVVRRPLRDPAYPTVAGRQAPPMTYMSSKQAPDAPLYSELSWIYEKPQPNPYFAEQVLDYDQILLHIGMDPDTPQDLGATVQLYLGGQRIAFTTTTAILIPKGTPFGPLSWQEVHRPHLQMLIVLGSGDPFAGRERRFLGNEQVFFPKKMRKFDYEQLVVRNPLREAGPDYVEGRQNPTMTYMSRTQVQLATTYLEFSWIWAPPSLNIPRMRHDNYDEVVWHIGSDPADPVDLGATLEFGIGNETFEFDTTHCCYLPRQLSHGPIKWKTVRRPMIEMALMLGAATWEEGWKNSFFDAPETEPGARTTE